MCIRDRPYALAHFSIVKSENCGSSTTWGLYLIKKCEQENWKSAINSSKFTQLRLSKAENWSGYLSETSQTHSENSRLDFLTIRCKTQLESEKKLCLQPQKKTRIRNGLRNIMCIVCTRNDFATAPTMLLND